MTSTDNIINTTESEFSFFYSWKAWALIIIVLSFIGINVFLYLAKGTDFIKTFLQSFLAIDTTTGTTKKRGEGQLPPPISENDVTPHDNGMKGGDIKIQYPDIMMTSALNRTINTKRAEENASVNPNPISGEKWCHVGQFDGQRVCNHMANDDKCASGNIFPTMDICINPNLRV